MATTDLGSTNVGSTTPLRPAPTRPATRRNAWPWVAAIIVFVVAAVYALARLSPETEPVRTLDAPSDATIAPEASPAEPTRVP